jgi:hypothetical protein
MPILRGILLPPLLALLPCAAQERATQEPPGSNAENTRVFGVLPNNRTTEASIPFAPITAKRKMWIAYRDSVDYPVYPTAAIFAGIYQIENRNPSFGQGVKGYAQRFAGAYGDLVTGNMMTEGIVPILTHEDPRYFRLGSRGGSTRHRLAYALTRIFVTRMDSGRNSFNVSEFGGSAIAVATSNAWYPDTRTVGDNVQKFCVQLGTDSLSNVLKEFWPDIRRKMSKRK